MKAKAKVDVYYRTPLGKRAVEPSAEIKEVVVVEELDPSLPNPALTKGPTTEP